MNYAHATYNDVVASIDNMVHHTMAVQPNVSIQTANGTNGVDEEDITEISRENGVVVVHTNTYRTYFLYQLNKSVLQDLFTTISQ